MVEWKRFSCPFCLDGCMLGCSLPYYVFANYFIYIFFVVSVLLQDLFQMVEFCKCSLLDTVNALCTNELIVDCFCAECGDSACRYLFVCVGFLFT